MIEDKKLLALINKARKKDPAAFARLCELKAREVIFLCVRELGSQPDGEDAAQEVFIRMQKYIGTLNRPEAFNVWLNRLVRSACTDLRRKQMREKAVTQSEPLFTDAALNDTLNGLPQAFLENDESRRRLMELIDELPDKYRSCVILHYYQQLSYAEVAKVLNIKPAAVDNNLRMARKILKLELENDAAEGGPALGALSAAPLVAIGPALGTVLAATADATVPAALSGQVLAAAGVYTAFGGAAAGASATAGAGAKLAAQVALAVTLVAAAGLGTAWLTADLTPAPPASAASSVSAAALEGRVTLDMGEEAPRPLSGITLELVPAGDGDEATAHRVLTSDGAYRFGNIEAGDYRLRIHLPEGARLKAGEGAEAGASLPEGGAVTLVPDGEGGSWVALNGERTFTLGGGREAPRLDIPLEAKTLVSGRIVLNGLDAAGLQVTLLDPDGQALATAPVAGDGDFSFGDVDISSAGSYTLRVSGGENNDAVMPDHPLQLYPGYGYDWSGYRQ